MLDIYTVAFFGHRYIDNPFRIEDRLEEEIRRLLSEHEYVDFLVGRDGEFDQFASSAVLRVRKRYRDDNSSLVLVLPYARAEYLNNEESFHDYYSEVEISYEASKAHPKAAIQIRNREMVDRADLILCAIEREKGGLAERSICHQARKDRNQPCRRKMTNSHLIWACSTGGKPFSFANFCEIQENCGNVRDFVI